MNLARLKEAEIARQAALDYINANPGALAPEIIEALEWGEQAGGSRLLAMFEKGELDRKAVIVNRMNAIGFFHPQHTFSYTALKTITTPAEAIHEKVREAGRIGGKKEKTSKSQSRAGKWTARGYLNIKEDRQPIKNQEAIGSGRRRVFAGTSYDII